MFSPLQSILVILGIVFMHTGNIYSQTWQAVPLVSQSILDNGFTGGEGCQWPQAIEADHNDGSFLLFGTDVGGIYRSIDGGDNWRPCNIGYHPRGNCGFAIDPMNNQRALAIGGNSTKNNSHGVYLTMDQGATWKHVKQVGDYDGYRGYRDKVEFFKGSYDADSGYCMVAYWSSPSTGLYKTENGGLGWTRVNSSYGDCILSVNPGNGDVYVANSSGFYKSTNGGVTFESKFSGEVRDMDVPLSSPGSVFMSTSSKLYKSVDGAETFTQVGASGYPSSVFSLDVHDLDTMRLVVCNNPGPYNYPIYYSHNGGLTWQQAQRSNTNAFMPYNGRQQKFAWHPTDVNKVWTFGGDWISSSSDGGKNFRWDSDGYTGILVGGIFNFNPFNQELLYLASQDYNGAFTRDGGKTWKYCNASGLGWGGFTYGAYALDENILVTQVAPGWHEPGNLTVSRNGGVSFTKTGLICNGLEVAGGDPKDPDVIYFSEYYSKDRGVNWNKMTGCMGVLIPNLYGDLEVYGASGNLVVRSDDLGDSWQIVVSLPASVSDIAIDHLKGRLYIVTSNDQLYQYENGTLTNLTHRIPADQYNGKSIRTVAVDPQDPRVVYCAGPKNVYKTDAPVKRSMDSGENWEIIVPNNRTNPEMVPLDGPNEVFALRVNPETGDLWAAGGCYGVWKMLSESRFSVNLTAPLQGTIYYAPSQIEISAVVNENTNPVTLVEFFNRDNRIGSDSIAPYQFVWTGIENGEHLIWAIATDSAGKSAVSKVAVISVAPSQFPIASLTAPEEGSNFFENDWIEISAEASDPDGTIVLVDFFVNSQKIATDSTAPYSCPWQDTGVGNYTVYAVATDNTGLTASTEQVSFRITRQLSYFEDFNDGLAQDWKPVSGLWKVEGNEYFNYSNLLYENCIYTGTTFALFDYSAKLKPAFGNYLGLIFNYSDEDNYYLLLLDASPLNASLIKVQDGGKSTLATAAYAGGGVDVYLSARIANDGNTTSVYINDNLIFDAVPTPEFRYGYIGLHTQVNYLWIDDIQVEADSAELSPIIQGVPEHEWSVMIYPNPVSGDRFTIRAGTGQEPLELIILDIVSGKQVYSSKLIPGEPTILSTAQIGTAGVCIVRISGRSGSVHRKIVFQE